MTTEQETSDATRPMRVLFVNQFYWPDISATAQQLADLAETLAEHGHDVEVLCTAHRYDDGSGAARPMRETHRGVRIRRFSTWGSRKRGIIPRLFEYAGFHLKCGFAIIGRARRSTHVVTLTDPPFIGLYATVARWLAPRRLRHVIWSMDLNMEVLYELGMLRRSNPLAWVLERIDRFIARRAAAVVVLGDCMRRRLVAKGIADERIHTITVWNRADQLSPIPPEECGLRHEHGLADAFVVMYSGNAGLAHTFEATCEAMDRLRDDERIRFVFVGAGKRMAEIEAFARDRSLPNFVRLPYFPRERINESLAIGDIHLVTLRENMAGVVVPCKLYGIMAMGRPVAFVGPATSDPAEQIAAAEAGAVIAPDDADALVAFIARLAGDPEEAKRLGANGRQAFLDHHERVVCCKAWEQVLRAVEAGTADGRAVAPMSRSVSG